MCLDISVCAYSELVFHSIKQWWLVPSIYPRVGAEQARAGGENKKVPHPTKPLSWPRPHGGELRSITISNQATPPPSCRDIASAHSDMTPTCKPSIMGLETRQLEVNTLIQSNI